MICQSLLLNHIQMLKKLTINNFQSHRKTTLEFAEGVNVIVGTSDSGKSAILRSLRWLIWNRPSGDAIRSWWGGDVEVTLETTEDTICRRKSKIDEYILNDNEPYRAFKTDVPQEITDSIHISEINFQQQSERYFLLNSTPGEVAKFFNKVAHLDQIDKGSTYIRSSISSLTSDLKKLKSDRKEKRDELDSFDYLEKFEMELEVLEQMQSEKDSLFKSINILNNLIQSISNMEEEISIYDSILDMETLVDSIIISNDKRKGIKNEISNIEDLILSLHRISEKENKIQNLLNLEEDVINVLDSVNKKSDTQKQKESLNLILINYKQIETRLNEETKKIEILEKKFEDNFPDICPLCNSKITRKIHQHEKGINY